MTRNSFVAEVTFKINSKRNKFSDLQEVTYENVDIVSIAETKTDASFPSAQFVLDGYHLPYRMDVTERKGGILVYVKSLIPSRRLTLWNLRNLCDSIQAIPLEINLRKEKWLVISVYRPLTQDRGYFLNSLIKLINLFWNKNDNYLIMGDFNMEPTESTLSNFLISNNLSNLMKKNACFKGTGFCIDLILANRK